MQPRFKLFSHIGLLTYVSAGILISPALAQSDLNQVIPEEEFVAENLSEDVGGAIDENIKLLLPEGENAEAVEKPMMEIVVEDVTAAPAQPQMDALEAPTAEAPIPFIPEAAAEEDFDENLFFDAEALVPTGELARKGAPSKVNPALSPGSRLVVARKNYNSGSRAARLVAAERAMKLGRYDSALQIYDGLYASNKRAPNVMLGRAVALQRLGRDDEALQAYERLLDIRPNNVEANINMQGILGKRYPAVALRNLLNLHQENPGDTNVIAQLAVVQAKLGQYPDAIRYLGMAASLEPENANHIYNMAVIADRAADRKTAIQYYEDALEVDTLYGAGKTIPRESVFQRLAELR